MLLILIILLLLFLTLLLVLLTLLLIFLQNIINIVADKKILLLLILLILFFYGWRMFRLYRHLCLDFSIVNVSFRLHFSEKYSKKKFSTLKLIFYIQKLINTYLLLIAVNLFIEWYWDLYIIDNLLLVWH